MQSIPQGRAADVVSHGARQVDSAVSQKLCPQGEIEIVEISEEVRIQSAAGDESVAPVEHCCTTTGQHRYRALEPSFIPVQMTQPKTCGGHQHCVSGSVKMSAL